MTAAKTEPDSLAAALVKLQAALPHVQKNRTANVPTKNGGSYSYKYADLNDVADAIHPLLAAAGLSFTAMPTLTESGRFVLRCTLRHVSGEKDQGDYPLPDPANTTPQQVGSAITYAKRYVLCSVTGVVPDEDDDGQTIAQQPERKAERGPAEQDPWQGPPVTDPKWAAHLRERVLACTSTAVLRGLYSELTSEGRAGHVADTDALDLKGLIEERAAELGATAEASA